MPVLVSSERLLPEKFGIQALPVASTATPNGLLIPPPVYPLTVVMGTPLFVNTEIEPGRGVVFATQICPDPSIPKPDGLEMPPPVKPIAGEIAVPELLNLLRLLFL